MRAELGGFVHPADRAFQRLVGEALADVIENCERAFGMSLVPVVHGGEELALVLRRKAFLDVAEVDAGDELAVGSQREFLHQFEARPRIGARQSEREAGGESNPS